MSAEKHYLEVELEELIQNDPSIWKFIRESSLDGVWYWDLENPEAEYMSPEFWRNFGFDPATKEHLASEWQDLIFPEDLKLATENFEKHLADPSYPYDQVVRYRRADGEVSWVRCRGVAVRDKAGKPIRLLGAHNDITDQKQQEVAAQEASDVLEMVFNTAASGIIALDADGRIVQANNHARHMLGGISDPTPFSWPEDIMFLDPDTLRPVAEKDSPIMMGLRKEVTHPVIFPMTRKGEEKTYRHVRLETSRVDNPTSGVTLVIVLADVSNAERVRQAVERKGRLDALGQLTGGIAHDFNNLLASQLYAIELARKASEGERRNSYLEIAEKTINRGRALTSRLLTFARRQPGLATSRNTMETLEEFRTLVRPMLEAHIDIVIKDFDPELRHFCDQTQLETALMNLVLNARDAILKSGIGSKIEIGARPVRAPKQSLDDIQISNQTGTAEGSTYRYAEITVSDDGPGMDDATLARCTDPFFTTKESGSGTGLGLAMVYGFVRQSEGNLSIYSEIEAGTAVQMTLPRGTTEGEREGPMPEDEMVRGSGETVFLVEDEPDLLFIMTEMINDLGYNVISADTGAEALARIEGGEAFDLLLTDVVMPGGLSGFELADRLRKLRPDVPVLYTSGYTGFTASEMGPVQSRLLQKPASPLELSEAINVSLTIAGNARPDFGA
ncbi:MAG: PAS domain-containing protein [Pseudomonadota bacterium]